VDTTLLTPGKIGDLSTTQYAVLRGIVTSEPSLGNAPVLKLRDDADVIANYVVP
jgi:hypothetical protein